MAPTEYVQARASKEREKITLAEKQSYCSIIDGQPYFPFLSADQTSLESIRQVTVKVLLESRTKDVVVVDDLIMQNLKVAPVSGGNTNALFRISNLRSIWESIAAEQANSISTNDTSSEHPDAVLMRIFGAEGIIDRDVETSTYAALSQQSLSTRYFGRFANGRLEGWLAGMRCLKDEELTKPEISHEIARHMAQLHACFIVPVELRVYHNPEEPGLWNQIHSWLEQTLQAVASDDFVDRNDSQRLKQDFSFRKLTKIPAELSWLEHEIVPHDASVAFCHTDVLASNVMIVEHSNDSASAIQLQLIDFEYGGINYRAFDIANHFNEFAGGTDDGVPNYDKLPSDKAQKSFLGAYMRAYNEYSQNTAPTAEISDGDLETFHSQVKAFILVNHLFWGLWGINQAAKEGCHEFDYLMYGSLRIQQYYKCKAGI